MTPFLTIVTRCCQRPQLLRRNIATVQQQTCQDLEQLFIVDNERRGLVWANAQFDAHKDKPRGDYVYHLDDDGRLSDPRFVQLVRDAAREKAPDVILVKVWQTEPGRMLPPEDVWSINWEAGERPSCWIGSGYNFVVRRELWRANAWRYHDGQGVHWQTGGDWMFMSGLLELGATVARCDVVAAGGRRRRGKEFEAFGTNWFTGIAQEHDLEQIAPDVWRGQYGDH